MLERRTEGRVGLLAAQTEMSAEPVDMARKDLEDIVSDEKSGSRVRALALNDLGVMAFADGEPERARHLFEAGLAVDDHLGIAHLNLGLAFEEVGRNQEAIVSLRAAAWCDSAEPSLREALVRVATQLGRPELADGVLAQVKHEHLLVVATEADLGFMRNDYHRGRRNGLRAFYRRMASLAGFGRVLEWNCGTGLGCQWMAEAGCRSTGLCLSAESLLYARRRHEHRGARYMRDLDLENGEPFDLVLSRAPDAPASQVASLAAHLAPGGRLIIPASWPTAGIAPDGFVAGEKMPVQPHGLPGRRQQFVVWSREAAAGLSD